MIFPPLQLDRAESSRVSIRSLRWQLLTQDYGGDATGEDHIRPQRRTRTPWKSWMMDGEDPPDAAAVRSTLEMLRKVLTRAR